MEYTIQSLSKISNITTRTLRYYDEINLLKPKKINSSGYRIYGEKEIDKLQQILFYKELGLDLNNINKILKDPSFDKLSALLSHKEKLLEHKERLDLLIKNIDKTILNIKGEYTMSNKEKFEGFKEKFINENEKNYGLEIRNKYGNDTINKSNSLFKNMSEEKYNDFVSLENKIIDELIKNYKTSSPDSKEGQNIAKLHKEWLCYTWTKYTKEAHKGLASMYLCDERFKMYYDKHGDGIAEFLKNCIDIFTN